MAKKCKSKKLNLRKYKSGSQLPKLSPGGVVSYNQENAGMFTPQQEQTLQSNLGTASTVANVAGELIDGSNKAPNNVQYANNTSSLASTVYNATPVGGAVNAVLGTVGEAVKTNKNYVNYDEFGHNEVAAGKGIGYEVGSESLDPLTASSEYLDEGQYGKSALAAAGFGWMTGMDDYRDNEADADKAEAKARAQEMNVINKNTLNNLNNNNLNYTKFAKFGGQLRKYQNGGIVDDPLSPLVPRNISVSAPKNKVIMEPTIVSPYKTFTQTPNQLQNIARELNYDLNDPTLTTKIIQSNPELYERVQPSNGSSDLGVRDSNILSKIPAHGSVRNRFVPENTPVDVNINDLNLQAKQYGGELNNNKRLVKKPIVRKYGGQTHEGPDEGIPVDQNGNPSAMTGRKPIALTEKGEVVYNSYVFSDSIKYKNK